MRERRESWWIDRALLYETLYGGKKEGRKEGKEEEEEEEGGGGGGGGGRRRRESPGESSREHSQNMLGYT